MLICQHRAEFPDSVVSTNDVDWSLAARAYPDQDEMPHATFHCTAAPAQSPATTADPNRLQGKQLEAYKIVDKYFNDRTPGKKPLRMVISGTAGTGKSYLIQCLRLLLGEKLLLRVGLHAMCTAAWRVQGIQGKSPSDHPGVTGKCRVHHHQ